MRIVMLVARTGRRVSEILHARPRPAAAAGRLPPAGADDGDGFVAKLRYQQTKIDGAPDTILVDAETVAIIEAQQRLGPRASPRRGGHRRRAPKYLFLAATDEPQRPTAPTPTGLRDQLLN